MSRLLRDQLIDDNDEETCPLCVEEFDLQDKTFKPCPCGYQICQFCYNNIRTTLNGLCPACRRPYDEKNIEWKSISPEEMANYRADQAQQAKRKAALRQKEALKLQAEAVGRKHLAGLRVVQKNLVYVTGLSPNTREPKLLDVLRSNDYFGQYGEIVKIVVSKPKEMSNSQPQSVGIYVTYKSKEDAARCIAAVNGSRNGEKILKAQHGTTKYCSAYLRNETCTNRNCMFLHEAGNENDTFTRHAVSNLNSNQQASGPNAVGTGSGSNGNDIVGQEHGLVDGVNSLNVKPLINTTDMGSSGFGMGLIDGGEGGGGGSGGGSSSADGGGQNESPLMYLQNFEENASENSYVNETGGSGTVRLSAAEASVCNGEVRNAEGTTKTAGQSSGMTLPKVGLTSSGTSATGESACTWMMNNLKLHEDGEEDDMKSEKGYYDELVKKICNGISFRFEAPDWLTEEELMIVKIFPPLWDPIGAMRKVSYDENIQNAVYPMNCRINLNGNEGPENSGMGDVNDVRSMSDNNGLSAIGGMSFGDGNERIKGITGNWNLLQQQQYQIYGMERNGRGINLNNSTTKSNGEGSGVGRVQAPFPFARHEQFSTPNMKPVFRQGDLVAEGYANFQNLAVPLQNFSGNIPRTDSTSTLTPFPIPNLAPDSIPPYGLTDDPKYSTRLPSTKSSTT